MSSLRGIFTLFITVLLCASTVPDATAQGDAGDTVIYIVRHAEKVIDGADPALSAAGHERAMALANRLDRVGIDAIHSTNYRRTLETAAPLAQRLARPIVLYDAERPQELVARILTDGGRHLVVGHSNTAPQLVGLLGGDGGPPIDEAGEYDRLYVVTRAGDGRVRTELRRYGVRFSP